MTDQVQMDVLAYSSRMINWAPLGKLLFTFSLLIVGLASDNIYVSLVNLCIGLGLMTYSTNLKLPSIIFLAISQAILILVIGCGMISILGDPNQPAILLEGHDRLLWMEIHITAESFNRAWLVFFRAVAGVTLMLAFATSTPIPHIAHALKQVRLPNEFIEIVVLVYRYAFLLLERAESMFSAARSRLGFNGFRRSLSSTAGIFVNVFITSLEVAERSQPALESRNYNGSFPIYRMPSKVGVYWIILTVVICVSIYMFGHFIPSPDMTTVLGVK